MAYFYYIAKNSEGKTIKGMVEAAQIESANDVLREKQLIVISLEERSGQSLQDRLLVLLNRVKAKDIAFFARQLAVLINATIPMVRSLKTLARQTSNTTLKTVVNDIAAEVDGGAKLSQSMAKYPNIFDSFFVHMIRAGETTGRLDSVLEYLAEQKEKDYELRSRIRGAMIYPAFILTTMIGIGVVMMVYVVPRLADIIVQGGSDLPIATKLLLGVSSLIVNYWWLIILFGILLGVGYYFYTRTPQGRFYVDLLKIKLPVLGPLNQKIALTRFAMSFSNLLSSGVPVTKALDIVGDIVGNAVYKELITKTIVEVESGNSIASVFVHSTNVPPIIPQMISVGEETGKLDDILKKLAAFYTKEVETAVAALTSIIEPMIIIVLGVAAGIMVAGILTPIYNITSSYG